MTEVTASTAVSMEENVDFNALRAKFNNKESTTGTSSWDSGSPKSPYPRFGRTIVPVTKSDMAHHRPSPTVPSPPVGGPGLGRLPKGEPTTASFISRQQSFPQPPPYRGLRVCPQPADNNKVKQTGDMLQNMMLKQQRPTGTKSPAPVACPPITPSSGPPQGPALAPPSTPRLLQQQPRQRSSGDVTPLRRPLPPDGPLPLKPKRPPAVNLEPFLRFRHRPALPDRRQQEDSPVAAERKTLLPAEINRPKPPQRDVKPSRLPRQVASVDIDDDQETYDDIGSFEKNESWSDTSQCVDGDNEDVYEAIEEDQVEINQINAEKNKLKEAQKQKDQMERQKKENELRKNFQLQGEIEVLHTARVRHDWHGGGKLDLSVRQDEQVEIVRVKNNPGGKWLARNLNGNYGYISNTCVDVDYEAVKRKFLQCKKTDMSPLPPPPPDPPQMLPSRDSVIEDDDDYDDVQPLNEDFPPPPPEISIDPKVVKELRKKFKYEGPLEVLHTMMVNPNGIIKKLGGKDLHVTPGEIVDVIQLTNSKKALCCNQFGKYGYVSRSLLLQMEGDIYDDVDYAGVIYDNDAPNIDY